MSRKLKFKIISCSSQQQQYPISSLLFSGSQGWQTRRFCTYPQEVTLQFYGVVNVKKIQLVSHHTKIASQVDILYYVPTGHQEQRFYKYGYLQFNRNQGNNLRQQKTIMVDINCLYLRLLFHKPYQSKQNFFSQVGLLGLMLYGAQTPQLLLQDNEQKVQEQSGQEVQNEEDEAYVQERVSRLNRQKEKAIEDEDYETANLFKKQITLIHSLRAKLRDSRMKINRAIQNEDYEAAKLIKQEISKHKQQIDAILEDNNQDNPMEPELQQNQFAEMHREQPGNQFMEPTNLSQSRHSKYSAKIEHSRHIQQPSKQENYDQRVIPTLRPGHQKTEPDQNAQEKPKAPPAVEEVQGKYIKDASMMQDYFDEQTVKKFFSLHWQHNLDSLHSIYDSLSTKNKDSGLVKCLITVVKYSSKQVNFQVTLQSLKVFQEMLKINNDSQALTKPGDQQNDLDDIGKEIVKRLTDGNAKVKNTSQQAFAQMNSSLLYGVQACSLLLAKYKGKLSTRQIGTRLSLITKMISQYGLGGAHSVPTTSLDFALQNVNNPAQQARKLAINLLGTAYKKDANRTQNKISSLKDSVQDQIREGGADVGVGRHKKK